MTTSADPALATVRIPVKTGDDLQKQQLARIYYLLKSHIRSRQGIKAEYQFKRAMDKTFMAQGMSYEQIRSALESRLNLLLREEHYELTWIATSTA